MGLCRDWHKFDYIGVNWFRIAGHADAVYTLHAPRSLRNAFRMGRRGRGTKCAAAMSFPEEYLESVTIMGFRLEGPAILAACCAIALYAVPASAADAGAIAKPPPRTTLDYSGKKHIGKASYYARRFHGRKTADGTRMDLASNIAASRSLPLGTTARITNLRNGKTAVVRIKDRGPYAKGRIVDVTPATAAQLGMTRDGVVPVEVAPIEVPQRDGSVKLVMAESEARTALAD